MKTIKTKLLLCDVFKEELQLLAPASAQYDVEFLAMGLHYHPQKLHREIKEVLAKTSGYLRVILGFGLCGGSLAGITAPDSPLVIPRIHDCLPVLLGSKKKYNEMRHSNKRTFFFSGGWVEGERMIIHEYERSCTQFGFKKAQRIFNMMFENYTHMMYIHTGHPRDTATLAKTREFADIFGLPCPETQGGLEYLKKLIHGPWDDEDFLIVPAHGEIKEAEFLTEGEEPQVQGVF